MTTQDLETYQAQLEQVEQVLKSDPDNTELVSLAGELKELISLTEQAIAASGSSSKRKENGASASGSGLTAGASGTGAAGAGGVGKGGQGGQHVWAAGDECLAKYSGDEKWYSARITSVGGSEQNRVYSVIFRGYNSTELVASNAIKRLPPSYQQSSNAHSNGTGNGNAAGSGEHLPSAGTKRKISKEEEEERERKRKKNEKKLEVRAAKAQEQDSKKATWQKFANKSVKKGVGIAGVAGTSIFKTPDNPLGKVGVTGSGKGMTEVAQQKKHKFVATEDE